MSPSASAVIAPGLPAAPSPKQIMPNTGITTGLRLAPPGPARARKFWCGAVAELKAEPGGELQVRGSGALIRRLLENDVVDEMTLLLVPVILGQGARLFPTTARTSPSSWWTHASTRRA